MLSAKGRIAFYGPVINLFVILFCYVMTNSKNDDPKIALEEIVSSSPEVYIFMISTFLSSVIFSDCILRMHRILKRRFMGLTNRGRMIGVFGNPQMLLFALVYMGSASNLVLPLSTVFLRGPQAYRMWYAFCMANYVIASSIEIFVVSVALWMIHTTSKQDSIDSPTHIASLITKSWIAVIFFASVASFLSSSFFTTPGNTSALSQYMTLTALWMYRGSYAVELDKE
ncbi:hypothetical protein P9112_014635 [Eukaryota sp. TZLM1-RC]